MRNRPTWIQTLIIIGLLAVVAAPIYRNRTTIISILKVGKYSGESITDQAEISLDTLKVIIKEKHFKILSENRRKALEAGVLRDDYRDKVKGKLVINGDTAKIALRLKGDLRDHWSHENQWSFRIWIKGDNTFRGISKFEFQRPERRKNLNEWFFHEILNNQGIMSLRYRFVQAFINDVNVGIYAVEENFETELIENNEKRAGVAFRFNCSKYWHYKYGITSDRLLGAPIEPYDVGDESLDNPIYRQFLVAKSMVEKWSDGKAQLDEVFDIDLLAKYFSIVDLYGGQHGAWIDNMKFYYNPVTSLIEPIGHDNSTMINLATSEPIDGRKLLGERRHISNGIDRKAIDRTGTDFINIWYDRIFENRQFYEKYVESLWEISDPVWINNFTDSISPSVKAYQSLLQKKHSRL